MTALTFAEHAAVLDVTSHGAVTRAEAAVHLSREALEGTDDMADYFAELHAQSLTAGLADARFAEMAVAAPELDASASTTVRHHCAPRRRNRWGRMVRALLCWVLGPHSGL